MKKEKTALKMKMLQGEITMKDMLNEGKDFFRKGTRGDPNETWLF